MTVTNEERREVARKLYEHGLFESLLPLDKYLAWMYDVLDCGRSVTSLTMRLADLIEPDPDLTCELEPTASERTNAPVRVYECDCCGRSCDSVYAEDYVYCPYCGRLNTNREVEVDG